MVNEMKNVGFETAGAYDGWELALWRLALWRLALWRLALWRQSQAAGRRGGS